MNALHKVAQALVLTAIVTALILWRGGDDAGVYVASEHVEFAYQLNGGPWYKIKFSKVDGLEFSKY
jgi:hypothetical protein